MRNKLFLLATIFTVTLGFTSCNRKTIYNHYNHTPLTGWERNDTLTFGIKPMADDGVYKEELGLRINELYPFMKLTLVVEQEIIPSGIIRYDTLSCQLVHKNGDVKSNGVNYYQYNYHVTNLSLNKGDSVTVRVRHNMKREIMPGISDIGIKLSRP